MKAIVRTRYGSPDVLELQEVEKPVPKDGEVLVQVRAASVNTLDWHTMRGQPFLLRTMDGGLSKPKDPDSAWISQGGWRGLAPMSRNFRSGTMSLGWGMGLLPNMRVLLKTGLRSSLPSSRMRRRRPSR